MESEFIKDLKDLSSAFEMHIKADEGQQRSIIVIGKDKNKVFTQTCGTNLNLLEGLSSFMLNESDEDWVRYAVDYYQKHHLLTKKDLRFGWVSFVMMFVMLVLLAVVCALWQLGILTISEAVGNIAFLIYVIIYVWWQAGGIWKKMAKGKKKEG